jgi:AraC family transcriptional regulator of adaptative response / DNA-3-methyladenine glycosylase II
VRLSFTPPHDLAALRGFLGARAVRGVERVEGEVVQRSLAVGGHAGFISVRPDPSGAALRLELSPSLADHGAAVAALVRRVFDLDRDPAPVAAHLARDPLLAPRVATRPGLRVPGTFDGFELASRAVLGQQVSVAGARTLCGRLVERFGDRIPGAPEGLDRIWPAAAAIAAASEADVAGIGVPVSRARALLALARAVASGLVLDPTAKPLVVERALLELPGLGPWTASYVIMRALGATDAFPAGDLVLRKALGTANEKETLRRAEAWRPYRAYAALHLWAGPPA